MNYLRIIHFLFVFVFFIYKKHVSCYDNIKHYPLLMPDIRPTEKESYFCTAFKTNLEENEYIVEFTPNATMHTAHHILLYGCEVPGYFERDSPRIVWDCGEMTSFSTGIEKSSVCNGESQIIYSWAKDAERLVLPPNVGFKIGGDTGINFLVLQVHYANVDRFLLGETDNSGIIISIINENNSGSIIKKRAGVYLLGTGGSIAANSIVHMETACRLDEAIEIHPFAFRTHTHKLGTVVSGWKINNNHWELIGRQSPQKPQMFYHTFGIVKTIRQNDIIAARCTMNNTRKTTVFVGPTGNDEMCNFYLMYYVNGDKILDKKYCFSLGPPIYYWKNDINLVPISPLIDAESSKLD